MTRGGTGKLEDSTAVLPVFFVSVVVATVVVELILGNDGGVTADIGVVRDAPPQFSIASIKATKAFTPTDYVYLPVVCDNFPPIIHVPEGKYLFVEHWTHSVLGEECASICIDFPAYYFDWQSGKLATTYSPESALVLSEDDVGYIGSGESLGGGGAVGELTKIERCPLSKGDITLHYVDEAGTVTLERKNETIVLEAGEDWVSDEEVEIWEWLGAGCVATSTHRITNYAFQDPGVWRFCS